MLWYTSDKQAILRCGHITTPRYFLSEQILTNKMILIAVHIFTKLISFLGSKLLFTKIANYC